MKPINLNRKVGVIVCKYKPPTGSDYDDYWLGISENKAYTLYQYENTNLTFIEDDNGEYKSVERWLPSTSLYWEEFK